MSRQTKRRSIMEANVALKKENKLLRERLDKKIDEEKTMKIIATRKKGETESSLREFKNKMEVQILSKMKVYFATDLKDVFEEMLSDLKLVLKKIDENKIETLTERHTEILNGADVFYQMFETLILCAEDATYEDFLDWSRS